MHEEHIAQATAKLTKPATCDALVEHALSYGMTTADILALVATYGSVALPVLEDVLKRIDKLAVERATAADKAAATPAATVPEPFHAPGRVKKE